MGSRSISKLGYGYNARAVYDALCAEADAEYGHRDGYSGAINSASGFREIRLDAKFINANELAPLNEKGTGLQSAFMKRVWTYQESLLDRTDKFESLLCVNLGIVQYVKMSIKSKTVSKRVFDRYMLYSSDNRYIDSSSNLAMLERKAESHMLSTGQTVYIGGVLKNNAFVTVKQYTVTKTQTRRKPKDMKGCMPMYAYWYVGWVSE